MTIATTIGSTKFAIGLMRSELRRDRITASTGPTRAEPKVSPIHQVSQLKARSFAPIAPTRYRVSTPVVGLITLPAGPARRMRRSAGLSEPGALGKRP